MKKITGFLVLVFVFFSLNAQNNNPKLSAGELFAASGFDNIIPLHWEEDASNPTEYKIYRKTVSEQYQLIATLAPGTWTYATFIDENVEPNIEYTYIIKNQNDVAFTNESSGTCNNTGFSLTIPGWNTSEPTINGNIGVGEWDDALSIDITDEAQILGINNWTQNTYAYVKVTDNKLFIAIDDFNNTSLDQNDQIGIFFDFNNDNTWSSGINGGNDGRYYATYNLGQFFTGWDEITGTYPNTAWGSSIGAPSEFSINASIQSGHVVYEIEIDMTNWYLDLNDNNFGMLIQSSVYTTSFQGLSGLFSPAGIWRAPITFADCTIQFDADNQAPILNSISELSTLVENDLLIDLNIFDDSQLQTVEAYYSIDGGPTETLVFEPSKSNYGYSATIPAQNTQISGTIQFYLKDIHNNEFTSENYNINWIADNEAPYIIMTSTPEIATQGSLPVISCEITDNLSGIQNVTLYYSFVEQEFQTIELTSVSNIYSSNLPDGQVGQYADYYITAIDNSGNISNSETYRIYWYEGGWYGVTEGEYTGNNFGDAIEGLKFGVVFQLADFEGKINKLAYMVPQYCLTNWSWSVVEIDATDLNNVIWTDNILIEPQTFSNEMIFDVNYWTEIEVESDVVLTGDIGLVIQMQAGSYWGRDANSTQGISWFFNPETQTWVKLGTEPYQNFGGDWTLKAHLYNDALDVEKIYSNSNVLIYPNPCTDFINIDFDEIISSEVEIININGQTLKKYFINNQNTIQINVQNLTQGFYMCKIKTEKEDKTYKFIKY